MASSLYSVTDQSFKIDQYVYIYMYLFFSKYKYNMHPCHLIHGPKTLETWQQEYDTPWCQAQLLK